MENWKEHRFGVRREDTSVGEIERQDDGNIVIRMDDENSVTVSEFLEQNPSRVCRKLVPHKNNPYADQQEIQNLPNAGFSYLWIHNDNIPDTKFDYPAIDREWEKVKKTQRRHMITRKTVLDIADKYSYISGKWIFYPDDGAKVDNAWELIVRGMTEGALGTVAMAAYVHPCNEKYSNTISSYVISIRNEDYTNEHQMNTIVSFLRNAGIIYALKYKLDAFTQLEIFPKNPYKLQPTIYQNYFVSGISENIVSFVKRETPPKTGEKSETAKTSTQSPAQNVICVDEANNGSSSVEKWLQKYSPSGYFTRFGSSSVLGRIQIHNKRNNGKETSQYQSVYNARQYWKKCISLGEDIDFQEICDISKKYGVTHGKWFFYVGTEHVGTFWSLVVNGIIKDEFSQMEITAEVSSRNGKGEYLISVTHGDFTNKEEVDMMEKLLRDAGVKCTMKYRPDIYRYFNSRRDNNFIYKSDYNVTLGKSVIERYEN